MADDEDFKPFATRHLFSMNFKGWEANSRHRKARCTRCGEPFVKDGPTQQRCETCRPLHTKEVTEAYRKRMKEQREAS
jgi:hypothetical protein